MSAVVEESLRHDTPVQMMFRTATGRRRDCGKPDPGRGDRGRAPRLGEPRPRASSPTPIGSTPRGRRPSTSRSATACISASARPSPASKQRLPSKSLSPHASASRPPARSNASPHWCSTGRRVCRSDIAEPATRQRNDGRSPTLRPRAEQLPYRSAERRIRNRLYRAPVLEGAGDGDDAAERLRPALRRERAARCRPDHPGFVVHHSGRADVAGHDVCRHPREDAAPGADGRCRARRRRVDLHPARARRPVRDGGVARAVRVAAAPARCSPRRRPPVLLRPAFRGVPVHVLTTDEVHAHGRSVRRGRGVGARGRLRRRATRRRPTPSCSTSSSRRSTTAAPTSSAGAPRSRRVDPRGASGSRSPSGRATTSRARVKVPVETAPPGFRARRPRTTLELSRLVEEWGFDAITPVEVSVFPDTTLSRGGVPDSFWTNKGMAERLRRAAPSRRRRARSSRPAHGGARKRAPFRPVWNRELFTAVKRQAGIPVFAVGGIRTAAEVHEILDSRRRPTWSASAARSTRNPTSPRRILDGADGPGRCQNSNRCVAAQMLGMKGVCYNPAVHRAGRDEETSP